ncbi:MAG: ABC-2 type transport system permease protein [Planctomycetota bacterium]|jgi:ABC-2 type transport system permease protein
MNFNIVRAVWKRDLRSWFGNPTGYVFIILFVVSACVALMFSEQGEFFRNALANLDTLNGWFPALALVFVSASTMNIWASERSNGTQELLFTLPGSDLDLQLGKFLSAISVYTVSLLFTLVMPIALSFLGNPDWGQLFANYVGFWLLGVMLVAVSMVGSQLTQNSTVALLLSIVLCVAVVYLGKLMGYLGFLSWETNGPIGQFALFAGGEIPFSGLLLFGGLTVAFFYFGLALLGRRHWREGVEGVHSGARFVGLAVCAGALTIIGVQSLPRIDVTVEGIHSLGEETSKLLAELDSEKPVFITAYVSEQVPDAFVQQKQLLLNLLDQFDSLGGAAVEKQIIVPEAYSKEARQAEADFGIRPQKVSMQMPGGATSNIQMYLGFAVQCGTQESVTPFVAPAAPIEYELMRSIRSVSNAIKKKVGILKTDVEIFGGFDMQTFQQKPQWAIAQELTTQYEVVNVDAAADYPSDIDCLIVPQGSSLEQEPMSRLQAYLAAGNPTILFEDPLPVSRGAQGSAADDQKGGAQARMMGQGGPPKGNWNGVLQEIGLRAPVGEIVFDLSYRTFQGGQLPPNYVFVRGDGLSSDSAITSGLQSIVSLMGGHVDSFGKEGFTFTPLLQASGTGTGELNGYMKKADLYRQMNPFTGPEYNEGARKYPSVGNMTMAARIVSKPPEGQPNGVNVIYVADIDLIGDQFFQIRMSQVDANFRFDNVTFALNCIDTLVGDESLIELRKRRPLLRKLTKVEEAQAEFENEWQTQKGAAEDAATESLAAAKNRLSDAVQKIKDNNDLDAQAKQVKIVEVQQNENRKLEIETAQIGERKNRRLEEAQHARDVARDGIHNSYRLITLLLAGLPGLLLGLITYFRRSTRAAAIVPQNRQVGGNN